TTWWTRLDDGTASPDAGPPAACWSSCANRSPLLGGGEGRGEGEAIMTTTMRLMIVATTALLLALSGAVRAADVPFISGGGGADEREDLKAKEKDYNLKIVAAATSGDYLADVWVAIESAAKKNVLETKLDGPILLAKLPPGTYTIKATYGPSTQTKTVSVPAQGLREAGFRWPER